MLTPEVGTVRAAVDGHRGASSGTTACIYHVAPDVAITQVMFMGGITVALLGVLTLFPAPARTRTADLWLLALGRTGRWLCAAGVVLLAAGVAASATAFALIGTAQAGRVRLEHPSAARRGERPA